MKTLLAHAQVAFGLLARSDVLRNSNDAESGSIPGKFEFRLLTDPAQGATGTDPVFMVERSTVQCGVPGLVDGFPVVGMGLLEVALSVSQGAWGYTKDAAGFVRQRHGVRAQLINPAAHIGNHLCLIKLRFADLQVQRALAQRIADATQLCQATLVGAHQKHGGHHRQDVDDTLIDGVHQQRRGQRQGQQICGLRPQQDKGCNNRHAGQGQAGTQMDQPGADQDDHGVADDDGGAYAFGKEGGRGHRRPGAERQHDLARANLAATQKIPAGQRNQRHQQRRKSAFHLFRSDKLQHDQGQKGASHQRCDGILKKYPRLLQ